MGRSKLTNNTLSSKRTKIGSGFFSKIFKLPGRVILKEIKTNKISKVLGKSTKDIEKMVYNENRIQKELLHDNILKSYKVVRPLGLLLEDIDGFSLTKYLTNNKSADINKRISIAKMVANGVAYLHENNIAHGDIKADNIIVSTNAEQVKIADFGVAIDLKQSKGFEFYDHEYMLYKEEVSPVQSDILNLGLTLKTIFSDFYKDIDDSELMSKYSTDKENKNMINSTNIRSYAFEEGVANIVKLIKKENKFSKSPISFVEKMPKEIKLLVNRCIDSDAKERPTAIYVKEFLSKY